MARFTPASVLDREMVTEAIELLRQARTLLGRAGAARARVAAARAMKSAEGAERHVVRRLTRSQP